MNKDQLDKYRDFSHDKLGFEFNDISLLVTALTHRSYVNEHPKSAKDNERLEFLGDAILEFVVTDYLFSTHDNDEGIMTKWRAALVRTEANAENGFDLGMGELIRVSKGEKQAGERAQMVIVADAFEALIGAIYLDQGLKVAEKFIIKINKPKLERILETGSWRDAKSFLQEVSQNEFNETPRYKLVGSDGPDHDRIFTMSVIINSKEMGAGTGTSKQIAETGAAKEAIEKLRAQGVISGGRYTKHKKKSVTKLNKQQ